MTFYFYDLETSSGSPKYGRIMQFAGQRTDEQLNAIGNPDNILIKITDDTIPDPEAILVHGITPQKTLEEGISEADFLKYFDKSIATADTIFVGFNNIRFDDEFIRRICFRNFYDPYQWHWKDGRSRWDLLDPIRMMRALRPKGLKWPIIDGKPTVKLELLAKENKLEHKKAHDALSDVEVLIDIARIFLKTQPKLFKYLLNIRDKKSVANLVLSDEPYIYTSGKYNNDYDKTTIVQTLFKHPEQDSAVVYDLRDDPTEWLKKSADELVNHWKARKDDNLKKLPIKTIKFNKCPAIAPLSVLDNQSEDRLKIDRGLINKNLEILNKNKQFILTVQDALTILEKKQQETLNLDLPIDENIYDGFWNFNDQLELEEVRKSNISDLNEVYKKTKNRRIREMIPNYKARNYPESLTEQERDRWDEYRLKLLTNNGDNSILANFGKRLEALKTTKKLSKNEDYLLTELQLYVESIIMQ